MKYLSERYEKVLTYKGFDICTLKVATPSDGDSLGYLIDHEDFEGQSFSLIDHAIIAINGFTL